MGRKKITEITAELLSEFLESEGYELYSSEFLKEGKDWFLRVYIDRSKGEGYIGTDDCEKVSRYLSERLDEEDPIEQNYYLEVSSPGMDRPLLRHEHYTRYAGSEVEISLYKGKDGTKNIQGVLGELTGDTIKVTDYDNKEWVLELSEIAKAKLAATF
ncbi:MAG: ribosome maturation factor RimP [Clostridiales bacterium]|nr:ribosome maturation factor RimP [Clostridiales bacterium]